MTTYWATIEPFWNELPTDSPAAYLEFYNRMRPVARDLLTTHWVFSEVSNGGFHQLFTNPTGLLVPEAIGGFRSMGLADLADITAEASLFFGRTYPREQESRIEALEAYAAQAVDEDDWNPFEELDDRFYAALEIETGQDTYTSRADVYATGA
jgi:hypothetical protein